MYFGPKITNSTYLGKEPGLYFFVDAPASLLEQMDTFNKVYEQNYGVKNFFHKGTLTKAEYEQLLNSPEVDENEEDDDKE